MQLFFKFKGPLFKPEPKIIFFQFLFWIPQHSYWSFHKTSNDYHGIKTAPWKHI